MPYTLEQLSKDIHQALKEDGGAAGKQAVCQHLSRALLDKEFVARHVTADQCTPRKVLYEDPELGFCICGHVYAEPRTGSPHDHGSTWAIYGVAEGTTEMTEWKIVKQGAGETPTLVEPVRIYEMKAGDCMFYATGAVHSPRMSPATKLVRVEGGNLDHVKRSNIKAA
jgi:predicted metal-dependent enzyme (double-stranded beta helix superfamily)